MISMILKGALGELVRCNDKIITGKLLFEFNVLVVTDWRPDAFAHAL
jgi:hypothetical protein